MKHDYKSFLSEDYNNITDLEITRSKTTNNFELLTPCNNMNNGSKFDSEKENNLKNNLFRKENSKILFYI